MAQTISDPRKLRLMNRFVRKGLAETPQEEAFLWLWTALEVFPMVKTSNIKPIGQFLALYLNRSAEVVKKQLGIGELCGMRSKLVHDGFLPPSEGSSALSRLENVVMAVVRHASGLPYDGALDAFFATPR